MPAPRILGARSNKRANETAQTQEVDFLLDLGNLTVGHAHPLAVDDVSGLLRVDTTGICTASS